MASYFCILRHFIGAVSMYIVKQSKLELCAWAELQWCFLRI